MLASATTDQEYEAPHVTPLIEGGVLALAIAVAIGSYFALVEADPSRPLIAPSLVAGLLVVNLVFGIVLIMLLGRRIAMRRAAHSPVGGRGRLHVRLVALFSTAAAVPMLLVTIVASLLFQYGVAFWSSDRARGMLENASLLVRDNYQQELRRVGSETAAMSADIDQYLRDDAIDSERFRYGFGLQLYRRNLSEAVIARADANGRIQALALVNPYERQLDKVITPAMIASLDRDGTTVTIPAQDGASSSVRIVPIPGRDRTAALVRLDYGDATYLYAARVFDPQLINQLRRGDAIAADYRALQSRSRVLQIRFNLALLALSLLIVGVAMWIALTVADRMVRPVGELVAAARRVEGGDLTARVSDTRERDEVGTLSNAFNRMTARLQEQNSELVAANDQLDARRALIEAVMAGVSAGVIATGVDRTVRIANMSATTLLGTGEDGLAGRKLAEVAPELDALLDTAGREAIVQVAGPHGETRTLAVRIVRTAAGPILTFDDITQQLVDQRRAAWSDVARRVAHEIKNPLTPIQLAAERLQRRYGSKIDPDDTTFARLTETIVRQVGDLRRMVDEFSSFARMPKPVFRADSLVDVARQVLFLHEVAHPSIAFDLIDDEAPPLVVIDRRQMGQALTNIVKNAVEAVEASGKDGGRIALTIGGEGTRFVTVTVADTGVGLPAERDRIIEPYMTTRAGGTGLGLAIVKKIVEEHFGTIAFADRPGGGTVVTMTFDTGLLAACDEGDSPTERADTDRLAELTRNRT